MREQEFKHFLTHVYRGRRGRPLGELPARNAASRCRRIERVLSIDLDEALRSQGLGQVLSLLERAERRFGFTGSSRKASLTTLRTALRYYADFNEGRKRLAERPMIGDRRALRQKPSV